MKKKVNEKKYKSKTIIFLLVVFILLIILFTFITFIVPAMIDDVVLAHTRYDSSVIVGDYVGLNGDVDKIYFGTIPKGGLGTRFISISSDVEGYIYITASGELSDELYSGERLSKIYPSQNVGMSIVAMPHRSRKFGEYNPVIHIYILKEKNPFVMHFLEGKELEYVDSEQKILEESPKISINITNNSV